MDDVFFCSHLGGPGMAVKDEGCEGASVTQQKSPQAQGEVADLFMRTMVFFIGNSNFDP